MKLTRNESVAQLHRLLYTKRVKNDFNYNNLIGFIYNSKRIFSPKSPMSFDSYACPYPAFSMPADWIMKTRLFDIYNKNFILIWSCLLSPLSVEIST